MCHGMGENYEKSIYNQLMDVMSWLDFVEKDLKDEKHEHKADVIRLNDKIDKLSAENDCLKKENKILKDDNARLKSIIETLKRRNMNFIENIKKIFMGTPVIF